MVYCTEHYIERYCFSPLSYRGELFTLLSSIIGKSTGGLWLLLNLLSNEYRVQSSLTVFTNQVLCFVRSLVLQAQLLNNRLDC